jgi:polyisoprenoid-binding protein YceI
MITRYSCLRCQSYSLEQENAIMSTATTDVTTVPVGTWVSDPVHSSFGFSVRHMVVATFRGSLGDFDATLTGGEDGSAALVAAGRVASLTAPDEGMAAHLQSPEWFDAPRHPEVRYAASDLVRDGERLIVRGALTIKERTLPLELAGTIAGPVAGLGGGEVIAVELEGEIDRTDYGLTWNAPLPAGGMAVGDRVRLTAHLEMRRA